MLFAPLVSKKLFSLLLKNKFFKKALRHHSVREGAVDNNERIEYLGDAIIRSIVAHYLFMRYPYKAEGFLTEMRSKMVNRNQLNDIAVKIGLKKITISNQFVH